MAKLVNQNLVEIAIENREPEEGKLRPYLGYSSFGAHCPNSLWHSFRWTYKKFISPRMQRLFNRGHQEEPIIVADLERAGMICYDTVEQAEVVGFMGHIKGHPDGDVINVPGAEQNLHNLEMKTANDKKFKEFAKFGVQRSNPKYFAQANAYMFHKKQDRTLFVITNKNNDERYYERMHYDETNYEEMENRAIDIICSPVQMPKISTKPEWHECKFCDALEVCHFNQIYERNCRTCVNALIKEDGEWHCKVYDSGAIPIDFQRKGCADHYRSIK